MISLVKDIINPHNWIKLISEPKKIKIVFDRIFYYPGLNFYKIKPKFLQNLYKKYIISFLIKLAKKNKNLNYFFFNEVIDNNLDVNHSLLAFNLEELLERKKVNKVFSCLKNNGVCVINNVLSDDESNRIKKIFDNINLKNDGSNKLNIKELNSNQKSQDVKVLVVKDNLENLNELKFLSDNISKNIFGVKINANLIYMTHESLKIPEKILKGDNNLHVDRYLPNLKLIYFPYDVDIDSAPFSYALGSHKINEEYLNFFKNNSQNIFDESNNEAKRFLSKKTEITVRANSLVLTLTNGFHGRTPFEKNKKRSALFLTYPDFNLFRLFTYWSINQRK